MKINEIITESVYNEAEEDTPQALEIASVLRSHGYKQLGAGAEATVWSKDEKSVIKIIMPDYNEDITIAAETFKKFYEICQKNPNIQCLPKFLEIEGKHYTEFSIDGNNYMQIAMEKLYRLEAESFEESIMWFLSDEVKSNKSWQDVKNELVNPEIWSKNLTLSNDLIKKYINRLKNMSRLENANYNLLFNVMKYLYVTGNINKFGWDLHTENVMQRKNGTLVITDPWFTFNHED
jgi:hypothetical protein